MDSAFKFFSVAYAVSWACWIAAVAISMGTTAAAPQTAVVRWVLLLVGTFAPAIVAVLLTAHADGKPEVSALLSRMLQRHVGFRWYLFAILCMPAIKAAVALTHRLATGAWPRFDHEGPVVIAIAVLLSTPVQSGEEIEWRGYALPRIANRFGLGAASMLVGLDLTGVFCTSGSEKESTIDRTGFFVPTLRRIFGIQVLCTILTNSAHPHTGMDVQGICELREMAV